MNNLYANMLYTTEYHKDMGVQGDGIGLVLLVVAAGVCWVIHNWGR